MRAALANDFEMFYRRCIRELDPGKEFISNWHTSAIAYRLAQIEDGIAERLIVNVPPRYGKSTIVSVGWAAFVLGHDPTRRILCVSYSEALADELTSKFRSIVESRWYRKLFPRMRIKRANEATVETTQRGYRRATTIYGSITGLGADLIIVDDPQKPMDARSPVQRTKLNEWFSNTLLTRLDHKKGGGIVLVMQRIHFNDVAGYLAGMGWPVLTLPAIALQRERIPIGEAEYHTRKKGEPLSPNYESLVRLRKRREEMGSYEFDTQFQQVPIPAHGRIIQRKWIPYFEQLPATGKIIQSWDTSAKASARSAWSVCASFFVSKELYYLIDLWRDRVEYIKLRDKAIALAQQFKPTTILIEDASTGGPLIEELKHRSFPVKAVQSVGDKEARLYKVLPKFEQGKVLLRKGAPYLRDLEEELYSFPVSKTDDQVDAITQALAHSVTNYDLDRLVGHPDNDDPRWTFGQYLLGLQRHL